MPRAKMLTAALWSAFAVCLHAVQWNNEFLGPAVLLADVATDRASLRCAGRVDFQDDTGLVGKAEAASRDDDGESTLWRYAMEDILAQACIALGALAAARRDALNFLVGNAKARLRDMDA